MARTHDWTKPATASASAAAPLLSWFGQAVQSPTNGRCAFAGRALDGYSTSTPRQSLRLSTVDFDCRSAVVLTQSEWHYDFVTRLVGELCDNMYRIVLRRHCSVSAACSGTVSVRTQYVCVDCLPPVTPAVFRRDRLSPQADRTVRRVRRRRLMDRSRPGGVVCGVFTARRGQRRVTLRSHPPLRHTHVSPLTSLQSQSDDVSSKSVR